jgi:hypothetical protein
MSAYFVVLVFFVFLASTILDKTKIALYKKKLIFFGLILLLIIIASSKNEITSSDTRGYIRVYNAAPPISQFTFHQTFVFEPGYSIIQSICKQFTNNYFFLFLVISIISIGLYGFLIWKYSPYPFLSIFLYYCVFFITREIVVIRYGCSSALMLMALTLLIEGKIFKSSLWAIAAFLFHYTSLTYIAVLCTWLLLKRVKKIRIMETIIGIAFPLALLGITVLGIGVLLYEAHILPPFFQYALSKGMQYLEMQPGRGYKGMVLYVPILYFYRKCKKDYLIKSYYFIFLFAFFMMFELNQAAELGRIYLLYMTTIILFMPILLSKITKKYYQLLRSYILIYSVYMFIRVIFADGERVIVW